MSELPPLPPGHTKVDKVDGRLAETLKKHGVPEHFSLNMATFEGPPMVPARIVRCLLCNTQVYRSLEADDALPALCNGCYDEIAEGAGE